MENEKSGRTKRLSIVVRPATYDNVIAAAQISRTSTNDIINKILEDYFKKNSAAIQQFLADREKAQNNLFEN